MAGEPFLVGPELHWLPRITDNLRDQIRQLQHVETDSERWGRLTALANSNLDFIATMQVDRALTKVFGTTAPALLSTRPVRLAVLASSTVDYLFASIRTGALRRQMWLQTYTPDYGQYRQELFDKSSQLHTFQPNAILFALDARHLVGLMQAPSEATVVLVAEQLEAMWHAAREAFNCQVIQQTALPVFNAVIGSNEHRYGMSAHRAIEQLNAEIRRRADLAGTDVLSVDDLARRHGVNALHDQALWHRAKQELHPTAAPIYGDHVARLLAAQQGLSKKCLVLDLDNTLWGGVIGDDGLEGIVLGQGSAVGEAFLDVQRYALEQSSRGIILAVCSKNDEANALGPFERHPEMLLKRDDIAAFVANWSDKPSNLRHIAESLNIGIDSLVFVDDNPFERNIVRRELPMIAVPELPEDPSLYASVLADAGYFEALRITAEDMERNAQYRANSRREALKASSTDMRGYLESLGMELRWKRFDRVGLQRIVQLINKTNQFNLRTQRYNDSEVAALIDDPAVVGLQLRLVDAFGDNGIIGIVIGRQQDAKTLWLDTWLMSCRVLGRRVEEATCNLLARIAIERGCDRLVGEYRASSKNGMVREHYGKLGFRMADTQENGTTVWEMSLIDFVPHEVFIDTILE